MCIRDRFGGGFRRTELISIDHEDLEFVPEGLKITIRRSKTRYNGPLHEPNITPGYIFGLLSCKIQSFFTI